MRIAVVYHRDERGNEYGMYIAETLSDYASWLGYTVASIHDFTEKNKKNLPENVLISVPVNLTSTIGIKWFYNIKLPAIIKGIHADIVICINGICALAIKQPQILLLPDITYLQHKKQSIYSWQKYSSKNFANSLFKCKKVITYSQHAATEAAEKYPLKNNNYNVISYSASVEFRELQWPDRVLAKSQFTGNKEFFVCIINGYSDEEYIPVLKAFSKFKKWQQSSMQLLMIAENDFVAESLKEKISNYKYREDVQLLDDLTSKQIADLMASSYALIQVSKTDSALLPAVQALQSAIPVVAYESKSIDEYCKEAALYAKHNNYESLGEQMINLYKNETMRATMIEKCKEQSQLFGIEKNSIALWKLIEETV